MKRIISTHKSIFRMSNSRRVVLDKFVSLSRSISEHTIKCIVYRNAYGCLDHWIHEIASWIHAANVIKCKSKLKVSDYTDALFGYFGDSREDARNELEWFQLSSDYRNYSDFEVSEDLIEDVYTTFQKLINTCVSILISKDVLSTSEWFYILKPILGK